MTGGRSNRQRGDYFERQTRDALRAHGWVVVRAGGSLGPADLVALRAGQSALLISAKLGGRIDPQERQELVAVAAQAGGRPLVASRPKAGHVLLAKVSPASSRGEPIDTLRVPSRPRNRAPREGKSEPSEQTDS